MTRLGQPEMAILAWLNEHGRGTSPEIAEACGIATISARGRLSFLERQKFIIGQQNAAVPPLRLYTITAQGLQTIQQENER